MTGLKSDKKYKLLATQSWLVSRNKNVYNVNFWLTIRIYDDNAKMLVVIPDEKSENLNDMQLAWLDPRSGQCKVIRGKHANDLKLLMEELILPEISKQKTMAFKVDEDYYFEIMKSKYGNSIYAFAIDLIDAGIDSVKFAVNNPNDHIEKTNQYLQDHFDAFNNSANIPEIEKSHVDWKLINA